MIRHRRRLPPRENSHASGLAASIALKEEANGASAVVSCRLEGSRGSDPRPLGLTMGWLLNRTLGSDPVHQGSSMPEGQTNPQLHNIIPQQARQIETADPYRSSATRCLCFRTLNRV
jgi:hypothetical protein